MDCPGHVRVDRPRRETLASRLLVGILGMATTSSIRQRTIHLTAFLCGLMATLVGLTIFDGQAPAAAAGATALSPAVPSTLVKAGVSGDAALDQKLEFLSGKLHEKNWGEAAQIAADALQVATEDKVSNWIFPLAATVPNLYALAGDIANAEVYYHSLMRGLLSGDIAGPDGELVRQIYHLTDALIQHGRAVDAIASLERLVASLRTTEDERSQAGAFLFLVQGKAFRDYLLYDYSIEADRRALEFGKKGLPPDNPEIALILNDLGYAYLTASRWQEAAAPLKESLGIREQNDAGNLREIGTTCQNLVWVFYTLGDFTNAERFANRAVAARKQALGTGHPKYLESRETLADVLTAEKQVKVAIEILEDTRLGYHSAKWVAGEAKVMERLADLYGREGDPAKSKQLEDEAIGLLDSVPDDPNTPLILAIDLRWRIDRELKRGDVADAKADLSRLLAVLKNRVAPDHALMTEVFLEAAMNVDLARDDIDDAIDHGKQAAAGLQTQFNRILNGSGSELGLYGADRLLDVLFHVASTAKGRQAFSIEETLQIVQWAESSSASLAMRQMAARAASVNPDLAREVRDAQDLANRRKAMDIRLMGLEGAPQGQRDETAIASVRRDLERVDGESIAQEAKVKRVFPEYASLVSAAPVNIVDVQKRLGTNEAMVKFYMPDSPDRDSRAYVWVITKNSKNLVELPVSVHQIADLVAALRCGLDHAAWEGKGGSRCANLLNMPLTQALGRPDGLPFDLVRSFKLYLALFDPVADLLEGKELIIVPSGSLTQLPFQVLVTAEPRPPTAANTAPVDRWRAASWLVRRYAVSILPSISSLQALRANAKPSRADKPFIGFGNPLLDGEQTDRQNGEKYKELAEKARNRQTCPTKYTGRAVLGMLPDPRGFVSIFRGPQADTEELRKWSPLPETVDELCEVGRLLGASADDIYLGSRATEGRVKDLSESGELRRYATVHFATHGALTGQVKGTAEPGLILTPPDRSVTDPAKLARDDGFLSASEIATLSLDANLVVMAACNTAGSNGETAEALSGVARAFFYAGARSLLVSHWEVYSRATVRLMIDMARPRPVGRAQALRQSMLAMIDDGEPAEAHPTFWAPFMLVGEGARNGGIEADSPGNIAQ